MKTAKIQLFPNLQAWVETLPVDSISTERKEVLQALTDYIKSKKNRGEEVKLNFICTHNSRRSQFSQIWAQTAADYYGVKASCYSGGVEVTAFNERAVESIKRAGFHVTKKQAAEKEQSNPWYFVFYSKDASPIIAFSKLYDDPVNGNTGFAAIMTCAHADENCPFIPGAEARFPVRYEDPKAFDDTPEEAKKYDERSMQIAVEMFYVFSKIV